MGAGDSESVFLLFCLWLIATLGLKLFSYCHKKTQGAGTAVGFHQSSQ